MPDERPEEVWVVLDVDEPIGDAIVSVWTDRFRAAVEAARLGLREGRAYALRGPFRLDPEDEGAGGRAA